MCQTTWQGLDADSQCSCSIWVLLPDLTDKKGAHTQTSATTLLVGQLEALETVTADSFLDISNLDSTCLSPSVVVLCLVIPCTTLEEHKVVCPEYLAKWFISH